MNWLNFYGLICRQFVEKVQWYSWLSFDFTKGEKNNYGSLEEIKENFYQLLNSLPINTPSQMKQY